MKMTDRRVVLETKDHVMIVGTFLNAENAIGAALLLHMMPADRSSWRDWQHVLAKRGIASLAIDLRGHGESTKQQEQTLDFHRFTDLEHQATIEDVRAALAWLIQNGFAPERTFIAGASIGANLALKSIAENPLMRGAILLSPGENYHGVLTFPAADSVHNEQAIAVIASEEDDEAYTGSVAIMKRLKSKEKVFYPCVSAGHGTRLFISQPELMDTVAQWMAKLL